MRRILLATAALLFLTGGVVGRPGVGVGVSLTSRQGGVLPVFDFNPSGNGVANLSTSLTINGTTVAPTVRYKGGDATGTTWAPWTYGPTLAQTGAGSAIDLNTGSPLLGADDDSVRFNNGAYYNHAAGDEGDIGTGDFVIIVVFRHDDSGGGGGIFNKDGTPGWSLRTTADSITFVVDDGGGAQTEVGTAGDLEMGAWYMVAVAANRDEAGQDGLKIYINAVLTGNGLNMAASNLTLANSDPLNIGALDAFFSAEADVAYAALYEQADWLQAGATGQTEALAVFAAEFAKLTGTCDTAGSAVATVATRGSVGTIRKRTAGVTALYTAGANWMRTDRWVDSAAAEVVGYVSEPAISRFALLESEDIETSWTKTTAGDMITANAIAAPDGSMTADALDAIGGAASEHGIQQVTANLTAETWTMAGFMKKGATVYDWAHLHDTTVADATMFFDLDDCSKGTAGAGVIKSFAEDWGNGWCRVGFSFTGTASAHTIEFHAAEADNDETFTGAPGDIDTYFWGMSLEPYVHPTSYVSVGNAEGSRSADGLRYDGTGIVSATEGSVVLSMWRQDIGTPPSDTYLYFHSDGGAGGDSGQMLIDNSGVSGVVRWNVYSTENPDGTTISSSSVSDGSPHVIAGSWSTDAEVFIDGSSEGTDPVTPPNDIDRINIGSNAGLANQSNGLIQRVQIFDEPGISEIQ